MYRNAWYSYKDEVVHLWTWDENGERVKLVHHFEPYLYIEPPNSTVKTNATSIYGTALRRIDFKNHFARRRFIQETSITRVFYNLQPEQQFLIDRFDKENANPDFSRFPLRIFFLDIEVYSPREFPDPDQANHPINLITVYDTARDMYFTFGLKHDFTPKKKNHKYAAFKNEALLLKGFLRFWRIDFPDILSGYHSDGFDIPYLINRIEKLLGEGKSKLLSPVSSIFYRQHNTEIYGKYIGKWVINGITCIDFLEAYKAYSRSQLESYTLDHVAKVELNEGKIPINATSLAKLADTDWERFVEYNVQDVTLLKKLDEKLKYMAIVRDLAYKGLTQFEFALKKVSIIAGVVAQEARKRDLVIPTFIKTKGGEYTGGYVRDIEPCMKDMVVTFDANSLYPNTIITLNLSPETKVGVIEPTGTGSYYLRKPQQDPEELTEEKLHELMESNNWSLSHANVLHDQNRKGIIPTAVDRIYKERVEAKDTMNRLDYALENMTDPEDIAQTKLRIEQLDINQYTLKILLNSVYGVLANHGSPLYDIDEASSVTLTGQGVIKISSQILDDYVREKYELERPFTHYGDTDSVHFSIEELLERKGIPFIDETTGEIDSRVYTVCAELQSHLNQEITHWAYGNLHSKDPRFYFKREAICPVAIYVKKKHYIMHVKDRGEDEPMPCDKIKYTGVEVVRSTMPEEVKKLVKRVAETMIYSRNRAKTNEVYREVYEQFQKMGIMEVSFRSGINKLDKYDRASTGFFMGSKTPIHCKASIYYNRLLEELGITGLYPKIYTGAKIKWFYCMPNKYAMNCIAFVDEFPKEFSDIKMNYEKMFYKAVGSPIDRLYSTVGWPLVDFTAERTCDLFDIFQIGD